MILAEDQQQEIVIRRLLKGRGVERHKISSQISPRGRHAGEQYVRERFPIELRTLRRLSFMAKALLVVTDADTCSVQERESMLWTHASAQGVGQQQDEPVLLCIPRRNIETWIHWLRGRDTDEETAYPKLPRPGDCNAEIQTLVRISLNGAARPLPPSMQLFLDRLNRLLKD